MSFGSTKLNRYDHLNQKYSCILSLLKSRGAPVLGTIDLTWDDSYEIHRQYGYDENDTDTWWWRKKQ